VRGSCALTPRWLRLGRSVLDCGAQPAACDSASLVAAVARRALVGHPRPALVHASSAVACVCSRPEAPDAPASACLRVRVCVAGARRRARAVQHQLHGAARAVPAPWRRPRPARTSALRCAPGRGLGAPWHVCARWRVLCAVAACVRARVRLRCPVWPVTDALLNLCVCLDGCPARRPPASRPALTSMFIVRVGVVSPHRATCAVFRPILWLRSPRVWFAVCGVPPPLCASCVPPVGVALLSCVCLSSTVVQCSAHGRAFVVLYRVCQGCRAVRVPSHDSGCRFLWLCSSTALARGGCHSCCCRELSEACVCSGVYLHDVRTVRFFLEGCLVSLAVFHARLPAAAPAAHTARATCSPQVAVTARFAAT
jgi:hypothetical protein